MREKNTRVQTGQKHRSDFKSPFSADDNPNNEVEKLILLVEIMRSVDTNNPDAELNAISISDGQGGRIYF